MFYIPIQYNKVLNKKFVNEEKEDELKRMINKN